MNVTGWRVDLQHDIRNATYKLNAEITRDHLLLLQEKSRQLSQQIMEKEEVIVLDAFDDAAILRLRDLVHAQIVMRELK